MTEKATFKAIHLGAECDKCPLLRQVYVPGKGPHDAKYAILGMAPGSTEIKKGEPFVGPSGRLLQEALNVAGVNRDSVYIDNLLSCKIPGNVDPPVAAINCCLPRLEWCLQYAEKILTMGKPPRDVLIPGIAKQSMTDTHGGAHTVENLNAVITPTYHPAHILYGNVNAWLDVLNDVNTFFNNQDRVFEKPKSILLETIKDLTDAVDQVLGKNIPVAVDLETTNIDMKNSFPDKWWQGYILCLGFHCEPGEAFIISEDLINTRQALVVLKKLFASPQGIYGHDIKFDVNYLQWYYQIMHGQKAEINITDDTLLMHACLDERIGTHGLKDLARTFLNAPNYESEIKCYLKRPNKDSYSYIPRTPLYKYLAYDIHCTVMIHRIFTERLKSEGLYEWPYRNVLIPALRNITTMEQHGIPASTSRLEEAKNLMRNKVDDLKNELRFLDDEITLGERSGEEPKSTLNPNAPHQIAVVLYDKLSFQTPKGRTIKGRSTNKEALSKLGSNHPFINAVQQYRRWNKLYTTYALKIANNIDERGYAHWKFKLAGTETGRVSAGLILTIPRKNTPEGKMIRSSFAAKDGEVWVSADFSQAELRWLGWYSKDVELHKAYQADRDIHIETAIRLFDENFTEEERTYGKRMNFAFAFGGTEYSFAEDTGIPIEESRNLMREYNGVYYGVAEWRDNTYELVRRRGWLQTPVGRMRRFPLITRDNARSIRNEAINFRVQSISSDCTMMGFCRSIEYFEKHNIPVRPILFLHDGVYFIAPDDKSIYEEAKIVIHRFMIEAANDIMKRGPEMFEDFRGLEPIPFKVDMEIGSSWGDL